MTLLWSIRRGLELVDTEKWNFSVPLCSKDGRAHYTDEFLTFKGKICKLIADISLFSDFVDTRIFENLNLVPTYVQRFYEVIFHRVM